MLERDTGIAGEATTTKRFTCLVGAADETQFTEELTKMSPLQMAKNSDPLAPKELAPCQLLRGTSRGHPTALTRGSPKLGSK